MKVNSRAMILASALAMALSACATYAQSTDPHPPALPLLTALDANGDGVIDAAEIANAPAAMKTLDKNADGQLTRDEIIPPPPSGKGGPSGPSGLPPQFRDSRPGIGKPPSMPIITALDTNGDGIIDAAEIVGAPEALRALDLNGDGQLTRDEIMPPPPGPGGPGGPASGRGTTRN